MPDRGDVIERFLAATPWRGASRTALTQDASFRRYWRLCQGGRSVMLMDAPPPEKPVTVFADIARYLRSNGLHAPEIFQLEENDGLMLLEDFGDDTFTRILARSPQRETDLYELAIDTLAALHRTRVPEALGLLPYDIDALIQEAQLLIDWFYPEVRKQAPSPESRESYLQAWQDSLASLTPHQAVLVLRDYHVDNLMEVRDPSGQRHCGLLDFQDALLGSPAYDLVSLVEDARRDIDRGLRDRCLERYFDSMRAVAGFPDRTSLQPWLNVLAAQRHAKVLGIFVRLYRRDGKPNYLEHLPRVLALYADALAREPMLTPVSSWMANNLPIADIRLRNQ